MVTSVSGKKGKGSTPTEDPNSLRSNGTARIIDLISEGPISGLVGGHKGIYLDRTPLKNADGTYNFEGITAKTRNGYPTQSIIKGFAKAETEVAVSTEVTQVNSVTRTISDVTADAVRIKIQLPALAEYKSNGDIKGTSVDLQVWLKTATGVFVKVKDLTIEGKTNAAYERAIRVVLPEGGAPWQVRIDRITADSTDSRLQNSTIWSSYTLITDAKLSYPDSAIVGLEVDAKQFGSRIPERTYKVRGLMTDVPSNYDPETRTYTGIWDGTFKQAWHSNPAWVLYALMTNPRFGLADMIPPSTVDKFGLYDIGKYCDEMVPDGKGGQEPRFQFNGSIRSRQAAAKVLDDVASVFRGMIYWGAGSVMVAQDSPATPKKLVSPANVIGGEFKYVGTPLTARHSSVAVVWNDPDDLGKQAVLIVQDDELIQKFGDRRKEVAAIGCTSRTQARRIADWILYTEAYETEVVSYTASLDHADVRPGDIISIADPSYAGVRFGGRLVDASGSSFTLDAPIIMDQASTYTLSVTLDTGVIQNYTLTNTGTETSVVTTSDPVSGSVLAGSMWVITATEAAPRLFRVLSNVERDKNQYEISAVLHYNQKYDYVERDISFDPQEASILDDLSAYPPTNVAAEAFKRKRKGAEAQTKFLVSWTTPAGSNIRGYRVWVKEPDTSQRYVGETSENSIEVDSTYNTEGQYAFEIRTVLNTGEVSSAATAYANTSTISTDLPVPTGWSASLGFDTISLTGDESTLEDFKEFRIYGSPAVDTTLTLVGHSTSPHYVRRPPDTDPFTRYKITQVDYSGNESPATGYIAAAPIYEDAFTSAVWDSIDASAQAAYDALTAGLNVDINAAVQLAMQEDLIPIIDGEMDAALTRSIDFNTKLDYLAALDLENRTLMALEDNRIETTLTASIDGVSANLTNNYYTIAGADMAIAAAQTTLQSNIDAVSSDLSLNYYTGAQTDSAIAGAQTTLQASIDGVASDLSLNYLTTAETNSAITAAQTTLQANIDGVSSNLTTNYLTSAETNSAISAAQTTLQSNIDGVSSDLSTNYYTKTAADSAIAGQINTFESEFRDPVSGQIKATALNDYYTQAQADGAISTAIDSFEAEFRDPTSGQIKATSLTNYYTRAGADGAISYQVGLVQSQVDDANLSIQTVSSSVDGIRGTWGVNINNNGVCAGFGLISELENGTATSSFIINANKFIVTNFDGTATNVAPFYVDSGVVYMDTAVIKTASIDGAKIVNASIDSAKIGTAAVGNANIADGAITTAKIGNAEISNAKIANLAVDALKIAGSAVETSKLDALAVETDKVGNNAVTAFYSSLGGGTDKQIAITNTTGVTIDLLIMGFVDISDTYVQPVAGVTLYKETASGGTSNPIADMFEYGPNTSPADNTVSVKGTIMTTTTMNAGVTRYYRAVGTGDTKSQIDLVIFQRQK